MSAYADAILATPGLQSYWRLGEASGTSVADAIGGRTLTNTGGATVGATGLLTSDPANTAYSFDGVDDRLIGSGLTTIDFSTADALTVEAWIKPASVSTYDFWLGMSAGAAGLYRFGSGPDGRPYWDMGQAVDRSPGELTPFTASTPYHVVFTGGIESGTIKTRLYLNGAQVALQDEGNTNLPDVTTIVIGRDADGTHPFHGIIDEVAIYNVVLSAGTIASHSSLGVPATGSTIGLMLPV